MLRPNWRAYVFGLVIGTIGVFFWFTPIGTGIEETEGFRWLLQLRGNRPVPNDVVIVDLSPPFDLFRDGLRAQPDWQDCLGFPRDQLAGSWPRCALSILLDKLAADQPAAVIFDVHFGGAGNPLQDSMLVSSVARAGNVILLDWIEVGPADSQEMRIVPPFQSLATASAGTGPMLLPVIRTTVTRSWSFLPPDTALPTLPMVALQYKMLPQLDPLLALIRSEGVNWPLDLPQAASEIRGSTDLRTVIVALRQIFTADDLLRERIAARLAASAPALGLSGSDLVAIRALIGAYSSESNYLTNFYGSAGSFTTVRAIDVLLNAAPNMRGKVVFIGSTTEMYPTPFTEGLRDWTGGVEIAATVFANFAEQVQIRTPSDVYSLLLLLATGFVLGTIARALRPIPALALTFSAAAGYAIMVFLLFTRAFTFLPLVTPLGLQLLASLTLGTLLRALGPRSQSFHGICLATDIKGSMDLARRPNFKGELQHYFHLLGVIVRRHRGVLLQAGDDSSMSYWRGGATSKALRRRACSAAIDLSRHLSPGGALGLGQFPTRIGLHAGIIMLSGLSVGESRVANLAGDTPNTAARLQTLCKSLGTWVLASAEAVRGFEGKGLRPVGRYLLVGRDEPVDVVELVGSTARPEVERQALCAEFELTLAPILEGNPGASEALLAAFVARYPEDSVARFILDVVRGEIPNTARLGPDGVIRMLAK